MFSKLSSHRTVLTVLIALTGLAHSALRAAPELQANIIESAPHAPDLFLQGWIKQGQEFYAASGLYNRSFVRRYREDGTVGAEWALPKTLFAEGLTLYRGRLYLLTWRAGVALVLNPKTLKPETQFRYRGEGWGITHNGRQLITSNGSSTLSFRNPKDFRVSREIQVRSGGRRIERLNELEFAEGAIWANVWQTSWVLKISPETGRVLGIAKLDALERQNSHQPGHSVLNGLAYDARRKAFWVSGKLWKTRYLMRFTPMPSPKAKPADKSE